MWQSWKQWDISHAMNSHFQKPGISYAFFGTKSTEGAEAPGSSRSPQLLVLVSAWPLPTLGTPAFTRTGWEQGPALRTSPEGGLRPHKGDGSQPSISPGEPSSGMEQKHLHQCQPQQQHTPYRILGIPTWKFRNQFSRAILYSLHLHKLMLKNTSMHRMDKKNLILSDTCKPAWTFLQRDSKPSSSQKHQTLIRTNHHNHNQEGSDLIKLV